MCTVKGNTPRLYQRIEDAFLCAGLNPDHTTTDRGHGRQDERQITALSVDPDDLADLFPGVRQIFRLVRSRHNTKTHALSQEIVYALTAADAERLPPAEAAQAIRDHWRIETILHRQKDVHMREDEDRTHLLHAPHNLGALRNLAMLLLRQATAATATWQKRRMTIARQPWRIHRLLAGAAA